MQSLKKVKVIDNVYDVVRHYKHTLESNSNTLHVDGRKYKEKNFQIIFKAGTVSDHISYDSEVNNGHGSIDFIASFGKNQKLELN